MYPALRFACVVCIGVVVASSCAIAQLDIDKNREGASPDQQFGFGIDNSGLHIQYAMGPAFHLGLNLNLDANELDAVKPDVYSFGPFAKFIFSGSVLKPFLYGAIGVLQPGTGTIGVRGRRGLPDSAYVYLPDPEFSIKLGAGFEYFFSRNVGLFGQVNLAHFVLHPTPGRSNLGLIGAVYGIEFFF